MAGSPTPTANSIPPCPVDEAGLRFWLDRLAASRSPRGADGLEHARKFFALLGNPQDRVPSVHLVGSAGKGTVAHLATHRLVTAGLSVATHMSPHVHDPRERFTINGSLPPWSLVLATVPEVVAAVERTRADTRRAPSYFAVTAAISWSLARHADSEMLIVEAGIGGRFDATNVISHPERIVVVTAIGLDHTDVLGSTIAGIVTEKADVIKGAATVVLAPQHDPVVVEVVSAESERVGARLVLVDAESGDDWRLQADAVAAIVEQEVTGRTTTPPSIPESMPPGRLESLEVTSRRVVLDGAHSAVKLNGLADVLRRTDIGRADCVVAAVGRSKDLFSCAEVIGAMAPVVIASEFGPETVGSGPRSWPADQLADALRGVSSTVEVIVARSPAEAADLAWMKSSNGGAIVVTGSFMHLSVTGDAMRRRDRQVSR